jgi:hypothetical protein
MKSIWRSQKLVPYLQCLDGDGRIKAFHLKVACVFSAALFRRNFGEFKPLKKQDGLRQVGSICHSDRLRN